jgi:hypothetical protein
MASKYLTNLSRPLLGRHYDDLAEKQQNVIDA